jgi:polysaccharide biosynthesis/export protein
LTEAFRVDTADYQPHHGKIFIIGKKALILPTKLKNMSDRFTSFLRKYWVFLLLLILLASCVPQKKIKYLQKQQMEDTSSMYSRKRSPDYKIQPKDNLYIRIYSMDEKSLMFFNKQASNAYSSDYSNDASIYLNSYSVSDDGFVEFPLIGKLLVQGLTVEQAKDLIQKLISEYLKETMVVVKMVNFNITIVGEVRMPGQIKVYQDQISIFEALSKAGDMTDFANRNKVYLIRQTKGGSKTYTLDLTSDQILKSDYYYLQPNDIIYISPLGIKQWGFASFPWALVFTAISTALLLINYFQ